MGKWRTHDRGSSASKHLEEAWAVLRNLIPGLPCAVIVLLDIRGRARRFGHFAYSTWQGRGGDHAHEIAISPLLFDNPAELLGTLLHEAAHAVNFAAGIRDFSGRYYHLKQFRDKAVQLGLVCNFHNTRYGWCLTSWPAGQAPPPRYSRALDILREIPKGVGSQPPCKGKGRILPPSGHMRLACHCPRTIHVSRNVASQGGINCTKCGHDFLPQTPPSDPLRPPPQEPSVR